MLLDRLIVKGNEIKEPGLFGKTVYVIKGNEIKEPGFLGKTVYVIKGNEIKEPGLLGRTVYVIKGDEIRTPGWFGDTVARTKSDGTVRYNKSTEEPASHKASGIGSTGSASSRNDEPTLTTAEPFVVEESLDELQKRLDKEIGCVVDYTNCSPDRKTYCPIRREERVEITENKIYYTEFSQAPVNIRKVVCGGYLARFAAYPAYILMSDDRQGSALVVYDCIPCTKNAFDEQSEFSEESGVSARLLAYGVAAQYCLVNGENGRAALWDKKFRDALRAKNIFRRTVRVRSRRGV